MGRAITKKTTEPTTFWNEILQDGIILLIVPSLGFVYVHEMSKSPGLHSTVYQPSQTHELHWWCPPTADCLTAIWSLVIFFKYIRIISLMTRQNKMIKKTKDNRKKLVQSYVHCNNTFDPGPTYECALSFFNNNKQYINTSVATQEIKGGFQAYMRSAKTSGQARGTKGHERGPMAEARWKEHHM